MTTKPFRPMLAEDATLEQYEKLLRERGTLFASYKLDGIRCVIVGGKAMSRSLKPIRNTHISKRLSLAQYEGLDGELIVGAPCGEGVMQRASSGVMSESGTPDFTYHVFDWWDHPDKFSRRNLQLYKLVSDITAGILDHPIRLVDQFVVQSMEELLEVEARALAMGYEGLIVRDPSSPYKRGRSTLREGWMLKLKRYLDSEAEVLGFQEMMHNANEPRLDERGYTKRSSDQAGRVPAGMLGALICRDLKDQREFNVGTGFDHDTRLKLWQDRDHLVGRIAKYRYLPVGQKDAPRFPTFLGWRHKEDL